MTADLPPTHCPNCGGTDISYLGEHILPCYHCQDCGADFTAVVTMEEKECAT